MSAQVVYRGVTFTKQSEPKLLQINGLLTRNWDFTVSDLLGVDGGVPIGGNVSPREFQLVLQLLGRETWEQELKLLEAFVGVTDEAEMRIVWPDRPQMTIFARPTLVDSALSVRSPRVQIRMLASDPYLYGREYQTVVPIFEGSGGLTYPVIYPKDYGTSGSGGSTKVPNDGTVGVWPRIVITGPDSGTVQPIVLENLTTGEEIRFTSGGGLTIPAGSTLVVDTHPARRVVRFTDGANRWNTVAGTRWFQIEPGGVDMRFRAQGNLQGVTVTVETRDAYL